MRHFGLRLVAAALWILALSLFSAPEQVVHAAPTVIYDDALAAGWTNNSWATVELRATEQIHSGSKSIAVTYTQPYSALALSHPGISTASVTKLRFFINGGWRGGQQLRVSATRIGDAPGTRGPAVVMTPPPANSWAEVQIPLDQLGANDTILTGLTWQDIGIGNQYSLFIDDIALIGDESPDGPQLSNPTLRPDTLVAGSAALASATVRVTDPQGTADIAQVTLDGRPIGLGAIVLNDDGRSNDGAPGDGVYGTTFSVPAYAQVGEYTLTASARDQAGHITKVNLGAFVVVATLGSRRPPVLPQRLGFGTNEWNLDSRLDWQVQSGVHWNYVYQYLTYDGYQPSDSYPDGWGDKFVNDFVTRSWNRDTIPVLSIYLMLRVPPATGIGTPSFGLSYASKLQYPETVQSYLTALKRAATQARGSKPVIFQLEPDFYGYMQQLSNDPSLRPAGVRENDPTSFPVALNVPGYPNTLAGFGTYMVDLVHTTAPNVLVAPHISMWATKRDPQSGTSADVIGMAQTTAAFMNAMGGARADLAFVEWSDRDAGSGERPWWDDTNQVLPRPTRALLWEHALAAALNKRLILWQVPVGNIGLDNSARHYRDNRAAYAFTHQTDLIDAGVIGVLFGGGTDLMTAPSTDGGVLARSAAEAYAAPAAPTGFTLLGKSRAGASFGWAENTESDLVGYQLRYQNVSSGASQVVDISRASTALLPLPVGTYRVSVVAYDALLNTSAPSSEITVTIDTPPDPTATPSPYPTLTPTPRASPTATPTLAPGATPPPTATAPSTTTPQAAPSPIGKAQYWVFLPSIGQ